MSEGTLTQDGRSASKAQGRTEPQFYLVFDCAHPDRPGARWSLHGVDVADFGRAKARGATRTVQGGVRKLSLAVADPWMSGQHARLQRVMGRWVLEDAGSKNGVRVDGQRIDRTVLQDGALVELGRTFFLFREAQPVPPGTPDEVDGASVTPAAPGLRTLIPQLAERFALLQRVARSDVSVVVAGESGTGKELAARAVHQLSERGGAFVPVNCGALPGELVESELFGHKKGAFTGAAEDRPGLVRAADRGTLFLDEIGELPLEIQPAFLRVLQEHEVLPVGATRPQSVDLRLVAATHRDLDQLERDGRFRADLLARLAGFTVVLPPLRERREDLGGIIADLLARLTISPRGTTFSIEAARALFRYAWPLNVRELEKALATAAVLSTTGVIGLEHLPDSVQMPTAPGGAEQPVEVPVLDPEAQRHREEVIALLRTHGGNVSAIARATGKARMQVQRWLKRYGLDPERYRS